MASLDRLAKLLTQAADALEEAAGEIRDLAFHADDNLDRVGQALVHILDVQDEIYSVRPDLVPDDAPRPPDDGHERPPAK
jgi:hypothetical protein